MNIFVLDRNPKQSARYLCNIHVRKMLVESAQMLSNAFPESALALAPKTQKDTIRRHSYLHHPCSKWVIESGGNFDWLTEHALEIAQEYTRRTGKVHFTEDFVKWVDANRDLASNVEPGPLTEFAVAISPDKIAYEPCQKLTDVVEKYRLYYKLDKAQIAKWPGEPPEFMR